jgi:hypothetical protein
MAIGKTLARPTLLSAARELRVKDQKMTEANIKISVLHRI